MERKINIACCSLNQTPLDWDNNFKNIANACASAKEKSIDILCFPELSISGYNCEDMFMAHWVIEKSKEYLINACTLSNNLTIILGCAIRFENKLYNCAAVLRDQKILGIIPKQHLANQDIYYEYRWFTAWNRGTTYIEIQNQRIPFGRLIFTQDAFNFGIEICEDAWQESRPGIHFSENNVDIIFNLSASHFVFNKIDQRLALADHLHQKNPGITYAYCNLLGNEAGRSIYDGSSYISTSSNVHFAPRFSFKDFEIVSKVISENPSNEKRNSSEYTNIKIPLHTKKTPEYDIQADRRAFLDFKETSQTYREFHEFTQAVSLGIYDYLRKSGNQRVVISLSGGADSAACAILSRLALTLALLQRGEAQVAQDLGIKSKDIKHHDFIYCVYQQTENNSEKTLNAAQTIAAHVHAIFSCIAIDGTVQEYIKNGEHILSTTLNWKDHDIALQNIQARSRGPLVWLIANMKNALLLTTSNRSEAAVGYATMDGDTCGGLSPIGGIDKDFLLRWLRWLEHDKTYGDFSHLSVLNSLEPTAELRPLSENQKDEDELMPYHILNHIEKLFIHKKLSPDEIISNISTSFPELSQKETSQWVHTFLDKWRKNQWKRERYAPSFHLDQASLDPKTWCRYPILSGKLLK